ncbi:hypothetical protein ACO1O0_005135 [Amphichorda felina]
MRLLVALFCFLVALGQASLLAGPPQIVLYYNAYRLEWEHKKGKGNKIAPGLICNGGPCGFEAFAKYNQLPTYGQPFAGKFNLANDATPTVADAVKKLRDTRFNTGVSLVKLLGKSNERGDFSVVLNGVMDVVENIRTEMQKQGKDADKNQFVEKLRTCMDQIVNGRVQEQSVGMIRDFTKEVVAYWGKKGIKEEDVKGIQRPGQSWKSLDPDGFIEVLKAKIPSAQLTAEDIRWVKSFAVGYVKGLFDDEQGTGKRHSRAVGVSRKNQDRIYTDKMCPT